MLGAGRFCRRLAASVSVVVERTPAKDDQQAPERQLHALLLADATQQACVSKAGRF
jgi:hypothetical protein